MNIEIIKLVSVIITIVLRYHQIKFYINSIMIKQSSESQEMMQLCTDLNFLSTFVCGICASGLVIAGNFRMNEWIVFHLAGASIFFFGIYFYGAIQTFIQWKISDFQIETKPVSQLIILLFGICSLVCCFLFSLLSMIYGGSNFFDSEYRLLWNNTKPGYFWHLLATTTEWIAINSFALFNLCTCRRMKHFEWRNVLFN